MTSVGVPISTVHDDILTILSDAFRENIFLEFIPELLATSYLGPDPDAVLLSAEAEDVVDDVESGASKSLIVAFSVGCALLLLKLIFCIAFPTAPKVAYGKVMSHYQSKEQVPSPTRNDAFEECDEPRRRAPLVVSLLQRVKEAPRRIREERSP